MILNNRTEIKYCPQRIISLVPSQTSLLHALGVGDHVIGITKFCTEPPQWKKDKCMIGGTKNPNIQLIIKLIPDLIIANKEENRKEDVELLALEFPVWVTDVFDLSSALNMISDLGTLTQKTIEADLISQQIQLAFQKLHSIDTSNKIPTAYLIWKDPWMTIGGDTFINDMMKYAGLKNIFENETRYPVIQLDNLKEMGCELLLLSSEPYPFSEKHINELAEHLPDCKIILVDGMKFSWYGDQLLETPDYLIDLLNKM